MHKSRLLSISWEDPLREESFTEGSGSRIANDVIEQWGRRRFLKKLLPTNCFNWFAYQIDWKRFLLNTYCNICRINNGQIKKRFQIYLAECNWKVYKVTVVVWLVFHSIVTRTYIFSWPHTFYWICMHSASCSFVSNT